MDQQLDYSSREYQEVLARKAKGRECIRCESEPRVAWIDGRWQLRCNCHPHPCTLFKIQRPEDRRLARMVKQNNPETDVALRPENTEVVPQTPTRPMTIAEFKERQELIRYVSAQMQDKIHFGRIPGTRDKSLWEAGAEYLRQAFNIEWDYEVLDRHEDFSASDFRYVVRAYRLHGPGMRGTSWERSAWSKEKKFQGMEPETLPDNVLDRAIKRAFVSLIRNVTGTSGYYKDLDASMEAGADAQEEGPLTFCYEHYQAYFQKGKMREPAHKVGRDGWCNLSDQLKGMMQSACTDKGIEPKQAAELVKEWYSRSWSKLSSEERLEVIERIQGMGVDQEEEETNPSEANAPYGETEEF